MNVISTRVHGVLDCTVGTLLAASPWLIGFSDNRPATLVPVVLGLGAILYSLVTKYEWGLIRVLPMNAHLAIDLLSGIFLMASPWLLGFAHHVYWPHVAFGVLEICVVALTPWHIGRARGPDVGSVRPI
jgi:hypothetical protein